MWGRPPSSSIVGLAGYNTFVPLYALSLGLDGSRGVLALYSIIVLMMRSLGARIPDRLGVAVTARSALAISAIALFIVGLWREPDGLYAGTLLFGIGQSLAFPALMTIAIRKASPAETGAVVGTFTAFFDLAFGAGAVSLGWVADAVGYGGTFLTAGGVAAGGLGLLLVRAHRSRHNAARDVREAA